MTTPFISVKVKGVGSEESAKPDWVSHTHVNSQRFKRSLTVVIDSASLTECFTVILFSSFF